MMQKAFVKQFNKLFFFLSSGDRTGKELGVKYYAVKLNQAELECYILNRSYLL